MLRKISKDVASTSLLSEVDLFQCPVKEITESQLDTVPTLPSPQYTIGIQKKSPVYCNSDGSLVFFVNSCFEICIYKLGSEKFHPYRFLKGHTRPVVQVLYNEELYILISCGSDGLYIWDLNKESEPVHLVSDSISCICYLFNNAIIAAGTTDGSILLFDTLHQYCQLDRISAHKAEITCMKYIEKMNLLATTSRDATILLWDIQTLNPFFYESYQPIKMQTCLQGHQGDVTALTSTQDGSLIISGGRDHSIRVWNTQTGKFLYNIESNETPLGKHRGEITYLECVENDTFLLSASIDGQLKCFEMNEPSKETTDSSSTLDFSSSLTSIDSLFSDLNMDLAEMTWEKPSSSSHHLLWSQSIPSCDEVFMIAHSLSFSSFFFSSMNHSISYCLSSSSSFQSFELSSKQIFISHSSEITHTCNEQSIFYSVSTDHHLIATNLDDLSLDFILDCGDALTSIILYQDLILTAGSSYSIQAFSSHQPTPKYSFIGHSGKINCLAFNPAMRLLASGGYDSQLLLHVIPEQSSSTTISPVYCKSDHNGIITCLDMSSSINGKYYLVSGGNDYAIFVYSLQNTSLHLLWKVPCAHNGIISSILFGCGMASGLLYSGGYDACVKVWSLASKECIGELHHHKEKVVSLCQTMDGHYLITASADHNVYVYDIIKNFQVFCSFQTVDEPVSLTCYHTSVIVSMKSGFSQVWNLPL